MAKPNLPNLNTLIQMGIDPKTRLPIKMAGSDPAYLKEHMKKLLTVIDEQDATNRFTWYNLPDNLTGELMERILYYKGQAMFFYMPTNDQFYFLPFALDGSIDVYGEYLGTTPLPFGGPSATVDENGKEKPWIKGLIRQPVRDIMMPEDVDANVWANKCVLLNDYNKGLSQTIVPRCELNEGLIEVESECLPFMRTSLISSCGIAGMRVNTESEQSNVKAANASVLKSALQGEPWIPIVSGGVEFQDLSSSKGAVQANEFMLAMQSLDNLRLSTYGLDNGGLFEKQGTILQSEADAGSVNTGLILNDGIKRRQDFCNIVNSIWGLGIWCEITQPATVPMTPSMDQSIQEEDANRDTGNAKNGGEDNHHDEQQ